MLNLLKLSFTTIELKQLKSGHCKRMSNNNILSSHDSTQGSRHRLPAICSKLWTMTVKQGASCTETHISEGRPACVACHSCWLLLYLVPNTYIIHYSTGELDNWLLNTASVKFYAAQRLAYTKCEFANLIVVGLLSRLGKACSMGWVFIDCVALSW